VAEEEDKLAKDMTLWLTLSEAKSIEECRKRCGMEPIKEIFAACKGCGKDIRTQIVGRRRITFYCTLCKENPHLL